MRSGSSQLARLATAIAIVAGIVFAAPLANALAPPLGGEGDSNGPYAGLNVESVLNAPSIDEALASLERIAAQGECEVPDWLQDEIGFLPGARDIRTEDAGRIVGYVVDGDVGQTLESLESHMRSLGWTGVSLGQVDGFTFVKRSGRCTWALATCMQVGSATSVVIRLA